MENDIKAWPLQMVFFIAMIGGAAGLVDPKLFDAGTTPSRIIPWILVAVAVTSALILYIPVFRAVLRVSAGVGDPVNPADGTLLARIGATNAPPAVTVLGRIGFLAEAIGTPANPQAGTLLARLGNLEAIAGALGTPVNPQPGTLLARVGHLEILAGAIEALDANPQLPTLIALIDRLERFAMALGSPADPQSGTLFALIAALEAVATERRIPGDPSS